MPSTHSHLARSSGSKPPSTPKSSLTTPTHRQSATKPFALSRTKPPLTHHIHRAQLRLFGHVSERPRATWKGIVFSRRCLFTGVVLQNQGFDQAAIEYPKWSSAPNWRGTGSHRPHRPSLPNTILFPTPFFCKLTRSSLGPLLSLAGEIFMLSRSPKIPSSKAGSLLPLWGIVTPTQSQYTPKRFL